MKRTTIFAEDGLFEEIRAIAVEEKRSMADVLREAMERYIREKRGGGKALSFAGMGRSGKKTIAEEHEDLLWKKGQE